MQLQEMGKINGHLHQATPRLIGNNGYILVFRSSEKPIRKQMICNIMGLLKKSNQDTFTIHHLSCPRVA